MRYVRLGKTERSVSEVGLGCGGHSRLGLSKGASLEEAASIVRLAIDLGITLIDSAPIYGTEEAVGLGIKDFDRQSLFLSTKGKAALPGPNGNAKFFTPTQFKNNFEESLGRLGTEYVDLFNFHGVPIQHLAFCLEYLFPELDKLRDEGKLRHIGITEIFALDTDHQMLQEALLTNVFDVAMVGFNIINQSARMKVLPLSKKFDIGTLGMFAVRRGLLSRNSMRDMVAPLLRSGEIAPSAISPDDPLDFLRDSPTFKSQIDVAYRFCRQEDGIDVVLTGTSNSEHLRENIASLLSPKIPDDVHKRLVRVFGKVTSASGD